MKREISRFASPAWVFALAFGCMAFFLPRLAVAQEKNPESGESGRSAPTSLKMRVAEASPPSLVAAPATRTLRTEGRATPEVRAVLKRLEDAHGGLKTVVAEFEQLRFSEISGDRIKARGVLYLQVPDRMRLDFEETKQASGRFTDSSVMLFVNNTFYYFVESLNNVDKYPYKSEEEARERLKMWMLWFGVSSKAVLRSYDVRFAEDPAPGKDADEKKNSLVGLEFQPLRPEVRKMVEKITVWFETGKYWPENIRIREVSGDVVDVAIRKMVKDGPVKAKRFDPNFQRFGRRKPTVIVHE